MSISNCTFSTRWSIFRFGSGECGNIAISNCLIYDTFGGAIKMGAGARSRHQNISFSNIVMKNVTGPISLGFQSGARPRSGASPDAPTPAPPAPATGFVRNISFTGIRAWVAAEGQQFADMGTRLLTAAPVLPHVEGAGNEGITVDGGDIAKAGKPVEFASGAKETSVRLRG